MSDPKRDVTPKRRYPPVYERAIPLALGVIVVPIVVLLLVVVVVLLGLFPGVGWSPQQHSRRNLPLEAKES